MAVACATPRCTRSHADDPDERRPLGGRFTLDAWVGERVRIFAAYDVSSALELAPEINGYRSLRLMLTGVY